MKCSHCRDFEIAKMQELILHLEQELHKYQHDSLTGMLQRRDFETKFYEYFHNQFKFYLTLIDVNGLHNVNRDKGYAEGDKLIKSVAEKVSTSNGIAYRIGGDEFAVLSLRECEAQDHPDFMVGTVVYSKDYNTTNEMFDAADDIIKQKKREYYSKNERRT